MTKKRKASKAKKAKPIFKKATLRERVATLEAAVGIAGPEGKQGPKGEKGERGEKGEKGRFWGND